MALPEFTMRHMLEAGCHFGHQTHRWNPKMAPYIFGSRNKIHIMDLAQTVPLFHQALKIVSDTVAEGGRVLFVGTKRQASETVAEAAKRSAQYYVNIRWLGGMLTNWNTISNSIKRLHKLDNTLVSAEVSQLPKKERLTLTRERDKLERALGGIKDMNGTPNLLFIVDTNKESIAIQEARRLDIPVVAILDSNSDPYGVTYPIPGNDDASRSINLYCDLIAKAALDGIARQQGSVGVDIGESENPVETVLEETQLAESSAESVQESSAQELQEPITKKTEIEAKETETKSIKSVNTEPTEKEEGALFTAPEGEPDDLKKISGVGLVLEAKLHALGVARFEQIASFTPEEIKQMDDRLNFKGRIERDEWVKQAKELML